MGDARARILRAIAEALLPDGSVGETNAGGGGAAVRIPEEIIARAITQAEDIIDNRMPPEAHSEMTRLLGMLGSRFGTLLLCGLRAFVPRFPFLVPFPRLPVATRRKILCAWRGSRVLQLRKAFRASRSILLFAIFSSSTSSKSNPLWERVGHTLRAVPEPKQAFAPALEAEAALHRAVLQLGAEVGVAALADLLERSGLAVAKDCKEADLAVECDVVVLGSGAGGGVAAAELASAGLRVIVVEKGSWHRMDSLSREEQDAFGDMYEAGGSYVSHDGSVNILAGSTLGGGTKVNWSASLRTPDSVLQEWVAERGLPGDFPGRFQGALDAVCERMGVGRVRPEQNWPNSQLRKGLEAVGWEVEEYPSNCQSATCSAFCNLGCKSGHKQSTDVTFLADAAQQRARILTNCWAHEVLWTPLAEGATAAGGRSKQVTGVLVSAAPNLLGPTPGSPSILLRAPLVVASCGALHTPALLLRSGITCGGNVGKNLRIHPASTLSAVFPPEEGAGTGASCDKQAVARLWRGRSMSVVSREMLQRGSGYGPVLAIAAVQPGLMAATMAWQSADTLLADFMELPNLTLGLVFTRDQDSGTVTIDAGGRPCVHYWPSQRDWDAVTAGLETLARALLAAGARRLVTLHASGLRYEVDESHTPGHFEEFIHKMRTTPLEKYSWPVLTAHQMGSACMGGSPEGSVCDPQGQCWEVAGLYVADASAMPTCSGVNPMITTCALACLVARGIVDGEGRGGGKGSRQKMGMELDYEMVDRP